MDRVKLYISNISYSDRDVYALILAEVGNANRNLPIVIRKEEALMISYYLEKKGFPRPLTYDLIHKLITELGAEVVEVAIVKLRSGIFYADISLLKENGEIQRIDARISDAIAVALRAEVPIYCNENIMKAASFIVEYDEEETADEVAQSEETSSFKDYTSKQLQALMNQAVQEENYEVAAQLKKELDNRK